MGSLNPPDIKRVLKEVDRLVDIIDFESEKLAAGLSKRASPQESQHAFEIATLDSLLEQSRDGFTDIRVMSGGMLVVADFYPPVGDGKPLSLDSVELQLEKLGVVNGVLFTAIRKVVTELALDLKAFENVVIARGTPPVDALPERWEVRPELLERKRVFDEESIFLDFKSESPFVFVKKDDLLAVRFPEQLGSSGWDVFGKPLDFVQKNPVSPMPGENVVSSPEGFRAMCDGCFKYASGQFKVDKILVLESGVGYATGHIDFAGDIHILGEIAAGFSLRARGSVVSRRVIDASEVISGGDVVTPLGIIGRKGSVVKAEGLVRAKFLERVFIQSRGPMLIQASILNCSLQTQDKLIMGSKGLIVGGRVQAQNGIDVYQVGSAQGAKAELVCGMDFEVLDKVVWARDQCLSLIKQMKTLEGLKKTEPSHVASLDSAIVRLRDQVRKLSEFSRAMSAKVDRNDEAAVVVRGLAHSGTYIEICHISYIVSRPMGRVRFVLDKRRGAVKPVPL